jgi:hypothetical protein
MAPSPHTNRQTSVGENSEEHIPKLCRILNLSCEVCNHSSWETQEERIFSTVALQYPRNTQTLTAGCFLCGTKVSLEQNPKIIVQSFFLIAI